MSAELKHAEIEIATVEATPTVTRRTGPLVGVLVIAIFGVVGWQLLATRSAVSPPRSNTAAVPVALATVERTNISDYVSGIGTVQAGASATVRVRIDGQLQQLNFIEGQDVKAGDVLAQIDPQALQAQLAVAEAQQARDQAMLSNARADLERYAELVKNGSISKQALDTQKALVTQHEATLLADKAAVDYARVQLSYTTIRAPISGRTGVRLIDTGNLVRATEASGIVVINQIDPVTVVFTLPESSLPRVNDAIRDSRTPLQVLAFNNGSTASIAQGKLLLINNQIDTSNGTVQLKASFANAQHHLWPGQYVSVQLVLGETQDALVVPAGAVQRGPEGTFVYVVKDDNTVAVQDVAVARLQDDKALISAGLQAGQRVVAEGQSKLRPGSSVIEQAATVAAIGNAP